MADGLRNVVLSVSCPVIAGSLVVADVRCWAALPLERAVLEDGGEAAPLGRWVVLPAGLLAWEAVVGD